MLTHKGERQWLVKLNCFFNRSSAQRVIMRPGRNWATKEQTYLWQTGSSSDACSGCELRILIQFLWDTLGVSSMIVLETHDNWWRGSGDLLADIFCIIADMAVVGVWSRSTQPNGRLIAQKSVIMHKGERQWLVEFNLLPNRSLAQRVIMRPGRNWATKEQTYLWQTGSSSDARSGCDQGSW